MTKKSDQELVVLVTGVFDVLHIEHIRFLEKARTLGSRLVVGIETDARVRQIKGEGRPINNQDVRREQLQALRAVDEVIYLPDNFSTQQDWESFIQDLSPDIYAVSTHTNYLENKRYICRKYGVDFQIIHEHNPDISTTKIIRTALAEKS